MGHHKNRESKEEKRARHEERRRLRDALPATLYSPEVSPQLLAVETFGVSGIKITFRLPSKQPTRPILALIANLTTCDDRGRKRHDSLMSFQVAEALLTVDGTNLKNIDDKQEGIALACFNLQAGSKYSIHLTGLYDACHQSLPSNDILFSIPYYLDNVELLLPEMSAVEPIINAEPIAQDAPIITNVMTTSHHQTLLISSIPPLHDGQGGRSFKRAYLTFNDDREHIVDLGQPKYLCNGEAIEVECHHLIPGKWNKVTMTYVNMVGELGKSDSDPFNFEVLENNERCRSRSSSCSSSSSRSSSCSDDESSTSCTDSCTGSSSTSSSSPSCTDSSSSSSSCTGSSSTSSSSPSCTDSSSSSSSCTGSSSTSSSSPSCTDSSSSSSSCTGSTSSSSSSPSCTDSSSKDSSCDSSCTCGSDSSSSCSSSSCRYKSSSSSSSSSSSRRCR
jgi:hypothetical protein